LAARAGVYSTIKRRLPLADAGRKPGAFVYILSCRHARTSNKGAVGNKMWCRICTQREEEIKAKQPVSMTRARFQQTVRKLAEKLLAQELAKLKAKPVT
jgi:hypothetical protein